MFKTIKRAFAIERERIQTRVNNQIRISPVRVIGPDGTQYGVIPTDEALNRARDAGLDLVEVAPTEKPPVCRIMDFGKYKYEKSKKSGQKTHQTKTKEQEGRVMQVALVRMTICTEEMLWVIKN